MCLCLSVSLPPFASNTSKTMSHWQIVKRGKEDKSGRGRMSLSKRENKGERTEEREERKKEREHKSKVMKNIVGSMCRNSKKCYAAMYKKPLRRLGWAT